MKKGRKGWDVVVLRQAPLKVGRKIPKKQQKKGDIDFWSGGEEHWKCY